ncbi:homocysteine S-methyltransferase [Microbacterium sp. CFBP9034]|uniref:homocysteine S-methyltransferase n=1 Tax=Microbacterium sp. CFBP9034 TaxID=3096540 RepID=UPI002A6AF097|nr:homocysteine S-methyltransferase [Microbacterium sp. CFBP9034]MDY0909942.1 homocysteine S-methyltransferase [Microbacterium sp. CFBP9034]
MTGFADALAAGPVVLDGGLGTLLEARGHDLTSSLWSAQLLLQAPSEIRAAHAEYFRAGARIAITSSYQVSYEGLAAVGLDRDDVGALLTRSVEVAREARADAGLSEAEAWVAASVGPYGASRADGSEYTGDYGLSVAELRAWHRPRLRALAATGADVLAVETLPSLAEVEAVCAELSGLGVPAWVSVTVGPAGRLRTGETIADAAAVVARTPEVIAFGVNCCAVADVGPALAELRGATELPAVVYPNSSEEWDAGRRAWSGAPAPVHEYAPAWVDGGARLIGGCCRVGPDEIARIARAVAHR